MMSAKYHCKIMVNSKQVSKKTPPRKKRTCVKKTQQNPSPNHLSSFLKKLSFDVLHTLCSFAILWLERLVALFVTTYIYDERDSRPEQSSVFKVRY